MTNSIEHFIAYVATLNPDVAPLSDREVVYRLAAMFIDELSALGINPTTRGEVSND